MTVTITDPTPLINTKFADTMAKMQESYENTLDAISGLESYLAGLTPLEIYPVFNSPDFLRLVLTHNALPDAPSVTFPDFSIPDLDTPVPNFQYSDSPYASELRDALDDTLTDGVTNGGTGLGAATEDAIWQRNEDRDIQARADRLDAMASEWAESGFDLPDGVLAAQLTSVDTEYLQNRQTSSRDIAVKQAELARQQSEVFISQGNVLENSKAGKHTQDQARLLEAARVEPEIVLRGFEAQLMKIKAQGEYYNSIAVKANAQAQIFKAQIDGYVAEANVGAQELESSVKLYSAEIAGASAESDAAVKTDANKIEQMKNYLQLRKEAMLQLANICAQMTAAMATSVSASASVGSQFSGSQSESESTSTNNNYQHNDDRDYL